MRVLILLVGMMLNACGPMRPTLDGGSDDAEGIASDAGTAVPYIAGDFQRSYTPPGTNYLNDHTLVWDNGRNLWHLYGITHDSAGSPQAERQFLHATASSLNGPWESLPPALSALDSVGETVLWAPYVFPLEGGPWQMVYWGGTSGTETRGMRRVTSDNFADWQRVEGTTANESKRVPGGRDPFVMHLGDRWYFYSVWVDSMSRGQIVVTSTRDINAPNGWSELTEVIHDPIPNFGWGNLESPFLVNYDGVWYLFLTRTGPSMVDYVRTLVFRSPDPLHFEWEPITTLWTHAAEIVHVGNRWYITSAGWTGYVGELNRGLLIAPLAWTH